MVLYQGQSRTLGNKAVSASDLASADIVLTTYDALARDFHHQPDPFAQRDFNLRRPKKYEVRRCPRPLCWLRDKACAQRQRFWGLVYCSGV